MQRFRIESIEISPERREAFRDGEPLHLRPKVFDLFVYLLRHRSRVVDRDELVAEVWRGANLAENSVSQCVIELRKALGDNARDQRLLKTFARSGYRFVGPVEELPPDPLPSPAADPVPAAASVPPLPHPRRWMWAAAGVFVAAALLAFQLTGNGGIAAAGRSMSANVEAYRFYSLGVAKARQSHASEAIGLLDKAIALQPDFAMAWAWRGYARSGSWRIPEAGVADLDHAIKLSARLEPSDRMRLAAWHALATLDFEDAVKIYRDLIAEFPRDAEAYFELAQVLRGEESLPEAEEAVRNGLRLDGASAEGYNVLSGIYLAGLRFPEAVTAAQRLVVLVPLEPNAYDTLGLAYDAANQFEDAEEAFHQALRLRPDFTVAIVHLGDVLYRMGRYQEAIAQFQRYAGLVSATIEQDNRGLASLAAVHRALGNRSAAEATLRGISWPSITAALLAIERRDFAAADSIIERFGGADRGRRANQRLYLYIRGQKALAMGRGEEALAFFREALTTQPPFYTIDWLEDCLGNAYLELGRDRDAIAEYQRVLARYPKLALVWYHLGVAFERSRDHAHAVAATRRFLDIWSHADSDIPEVIAGRKLRE